MTVGDGAVPETDPLDARSSVLLKIGQAARIVGVSVSRLRQWENERLIAPRRTASGQRLYTMEDVRRLERIRRLLATKSMTVVGVRQALGEPEREDAVDHEDSAALGARVRELRSRQRMSLRELSRRIGVSPSALSAFERGVSTPSIGRITQIAHALGTTTPDLLGMTVGGNGSVVRADRRTTLPLGAPGVVIENLYDASTVLQSQLVTVEPGRGSGAPMSHAGEEFLTVIEGEIELVLDGIERVVLGTGDSMTFASTRPHSYTNRGAVTARVVWVNTPPTF